MEFAICTEFQVNRMNFVESRRVRVTIFSGRLLGFNAVSKGVFIIYERGENLKLNFHFFRFPSFPSPKKKYLNVFRPPPPSSPPSDNKIFPAVQR